MALGVLMANDAEARWMARDTRSAAVMSVENISVLFVQGR